MGIKLSEIDEGSKITLHLRRANKKMEMEAAIKKIIREDVAIIELDYNTDKILSFEGIGVDMEYNFEGTMPIVWHKVRIVPYKSEYVLQTSIDGIRRNRRNCFRVGISTNAPDRREGHGSRNVLIRDLSLSGFSITDKDKELKLRKGEQIRVVLDDMGYVLNLLGTVVRIEERETKTIYGLEINNLCKELSLYLHEKQRRKKAAVFKATM